MNNNDERFTTALFDDRERAEKAYQHALQQGYSDKDINVMMSDESRKEYYDSNLVKEEGTKTTEGLAIGGVTGGAIGGIVAAVAAIGTSLVIPGLGLVIAGPLAAGLAGAGAGSITGGLVGSLVGWGIPEEKAKLYESGIKSGGIVLGVNEKNPQSNLEKDWERF